MKTRFSLKYFVIYCRKLGDLIKKHTKIQLDIIFIKTCKRKYLIPTFAKANAAIKHGTKKLKINIALAVLETEIQKKHDEKGKIKKQIGDIKFHLKSSLTLTLYNSLLHRINIAVKSRFKAITTRHLNKLSNLRNKRSTCSSNSNHISFIKTLFIMSYYTLT